MMWLNSLANEDAIKWNGFNCYIVREQCAIKPASIYMFCLLIDSPPAHHDTVLSTFIYMQNSLKDMGMKFVHISIDMQLFAIAKQICWKEKFQCVVLHPGGIYLNQSEGGGKCRWYVGFRHKLTLPDFTRSNKVTMVSGCNCC